MSGTITLISCCLAATWLAVHGSRLTSFNDTISKKIVCYFTNWAQYRQGEGKYVPEDIDPQLCTHYIFAFGWTKKHEVSSYDWDDESQDGRKGLFERLVEVKNKNEDAKVLLAIGGRTFGTQRFKDMASNTYNRMLFVSSAIKYLRDRNFDGVNLDWQFPMGKADKKNFVLVLKDLREAFEEESKDKNQPRLLVTVSGSAGFEIIRSGYDVASVATHCDFITILAYNFHGHWESQTGHNSPLYSISTESKWRKHLCTAAGVETWEKLGTPKEKIIVGLATFGRTFTLYNPDENGMKAPAVGGGKPGNFTGDEGFMAYYEVCDFIKKGAKYVWDDEQKVPYAVLGDQWVGFDDERSIRTKLKWIKENGYGGAMVWALDMDDFQGNCLDGIKNPLIGAMGEELLGHQKRPVTDLEALSRRIIKSKLKSKSAAVVAGTVPPKNDFL